MRNMNMSVQQYYFKTAQSYFQAFIFSILVFTVLIVISIFLPSRPPLGLIFIPFFCFACVQLQGYMKYLRRSRESVPVTYGANMSNFFSYSDVLLTLAPAPALRLMLFHPNSLLIGEIKELKAKKWRYLLPDIIDLRLKKKFGLFDHQGNLLAMFIVKNQQVDILDVELNSVAVYENQQQTGHVVETGAEYMRKDESSLYTDIRLLKGEQLVSRLQKGWMPTGWSEYFCVNTPILSFETYTDKTDKLLALAAMISQYQYENH